MSFSLVSTAGEELRRPIRRGLWNICLFGSATSVARSARSMHKNPYTAFSDVSVVAAALKCGPSGGQSPPGSAPPHWSSSGCTARRGHLVVQVPSAGSVTAQHRRRVDHEDLRSVATEARSAAGIGLRADSSWRKSSGAQQRRGH